MRRCFGNSSAVISILMVIAFLLTGCGSTNTPVGNEKQSLTVYCSEDTSDSFNSYITRIQEFGNVFDVDIDLKVFEDVAEMEELLKVELPAGQGPDVIVTNALSGLDMMALAQSGAFYDLMEIIAEESTFNDENYYTSVMRAGQLNGKQYIVPLSFSLPVFVSSDSALEEAGIDWDSSTTLEMYEQTLEYLKSDNDMRISGWGGWIDTSVPLLFSCGREPISYETGEVMLDGDIERIVFELGAEIYNQGNAWLGEILNKPFDSEVMMKDYASLPLIYSNTNPSPSLLKFYYSAYAANDKADEFRMNMMPDENGEYCAKVDEFAAVTVNAKDPKLAWILLHDVIDHEVGPEFCGGCSLNRSRTEKCLNDLAESNAQTLNRFHVVKMPRELVEQLSEAYDRITDAELYQLSPLYTTIREEMRTFRRGEIDLDTMIENINSMVKIYMNE